MPDRPDDHGTVFWITGLPGAGKSCVARELIDLLRGGGVQTAILLDGDELRDVLRAYGKSADERLGLAMTYSRLAGLLSAQGADVVVATVSLWHQCHGWNRENFPNYYEVHLRPPFSILRQRDKKGLYSGYEAGEVSQVPGYDLAIEEPLTPDLRFENDPPQSATEMARLVYGAWLMRKDVQ